MTEYQPHIIEEFADRLYAQASSIIISHTVLGGVIGAVAGYGATRGTSINGVAWMASGLVIGAIGYSIGKQKAFTLKLQAQTSLCQVKIEQNTRKG